MRVLHLWGSGGAGIWVLMHFWQSLLAPLVSSTISWQFFESICENDNLDLNCSWFFLSFQSETELQLGRESYQATTKAVGCSWLVWLLSLLAALSGLTAMGLGAAQALTAPGLDVNWAVMLCTFSSWLSNSGCFSCCGCILFPRSSS